MPKKKRILFMPASCGDAHLFNCNQLAKALAKEGHKTAFALGSSLMQAAKNFGIGKTYQIIDSCYLAKSEGDLFERITKRSYLERSLAEEKEIIKRFKPDLIISDYRITAGISALLHKLPWVSMLAQLWYLPEYRYLLQNLYNKAKIRYFSLESIAADCRRWAKRMNWTFEKAKMPGISDLMQIYISPFCTLIRTIPPFAENCSLPENFHLVGPFFTRSVKRRSTQDVIAKLRKFHINIAPDQKTIVLRLSGIIKNKTAATKWIEMVKKRFKYTEFQLIIAAKGLRGAMCESIQISSFLPFELLFQLNNLILISTGGLNTTSQAMAKGIPHLVVPTQIENVYNAFTAKQLGVADVLFPPFKREPEIAFKKIDNLFNAKEYKLSLKKVKKYFKQYSGVDAAIECLKKQNLI